MKFDFMSKSLSSLADIQTGPFGSQLHKEDYVDIGTPIVTVEHLGRKRFSEQNLPCVSAQDKERLSKYILQEGDIVFSRVGSVDRCSYVSKEYAGWMFSGRCLRVRPNADIDSQFLYYYFTLETTKQFVRGIATGATMPSINTKFMGEVPVVYPSIEIQRKIAGILSAIDNKIDVNNAINENLQEQARSIFQSWFIDYEPFGVSAPSDWCLSTLGRIAVMKTDSWSPAKNPDVVVEHYSIPAYDEQHYPVFEIASGIKSNKYFLTSDSVMISKLNPDTKRIWRPMCLSGHPVCSTEFIVYEAKKKGQRDYIYSLIDSVPFFNHLCSHTTGSTNSRQRATPKSTLDFALCLPPDSVIEDFCQIVTPMYDLIASNVVENQSLAKARNNLLPRLMSGELDVSALDL